MQQFLDNYERAERDHQKQAKDLEWRINRRTKQIERLRGRLLKLGSGPSWIDEIIKPIAEEMLKQLPGRYYDILGPFGLGSETAIHFYKEEARGELDGCISITFRPNSLEVGDIKIVVVDYKVSTGQYSPGSIGEMNGFNHPAVPVPEHDTIAWLLAFMCKEEATATTNKR